MCRFRMTACAVAMLAAGVVSAQDQPQLRPGAPPRTGIPPRAGTAPAGEREAGFYRASEIIGTTVRSGDGQELGQIQDLLIERRSQQIRYFLLGDGAAVEAAGSVTVVPWTVARPEFVGEERFVTLPIEVQRFEQAPSFTWQEIQTGPAGWATEVDRFYGVRGRAGVPGVGVEIDVDGRPGRRPGARGREVEIERDGDVEIEGRARPRAGVNVRPNGEVEVEPQGEDVEVEGRVRPDGSGRIEVEGDE